MLVSFIGCPSSGKTTTAAMTFARLKDLGYTVEFIAEAARRYIIEKRLEDRLPPGEHPVLTDADQQQIMAAQFSQEELYLRSCGHDITIVTDSSPLNSLLYMSADSRTSNGETQRIREKVLERGNVLYFYCPPIPPGDHGNHEDQNRIHSYEESLKIDDSIHLVLPDVPLVPLVGPTHQRVAVVFDKVLSALLEKLRGPQCLS